MVTRRGQIASIAYPHDENPSDTRNRVKNVEPHQDNWRCYLAEVTHETNSFEDAESWIASKVNGTQPRVTSNSELYRANHDDSSKNNKEQDKPKINSFNFRPPLPKTSNNVDYYTNPTPGCSKDSQSLQRDCTTETSQTTNSTIGSTSGNKSEPRTKSRYAESDYDSDESSRLVICEDTMPSPLTQEPNEVTDNKLGNIASKTTTALLNQQNDLSLSSIQISDVRSTRNTNNDEMTSNDATSLVRESTSHNKTPISHNEPSTSSNRPSTSFDRPSISYDRSSTTHEVSSSSYNAPSTSSNGPFTSGKGPSTSSEGPPTSQNLQDFTANLLINMNGVPTLIPLHLIDNKLKPEQIAKKVTTASQTPLLTTSKEIPLIISQNPHQNVPRKQESPTRNTMSQTAPRSITINAQKNKIKQGKNTKTLHHVPKVQFKPAKYQARENHHSKRIQHKTYRKNNSQQGQHRPLTGYKGPTERTVPPTERDLIDLQQTVSAPKPPSSEPSYTTNQSLQTAYQKFIQSVQKSLITVTGTPNEINNPNSAATSRDKEATTSRDALSFAVPKCFSNQSPRPQLPAQQNRMPKQCSTTRNSTTNQIAVQNPNLASEQKMMDLVGELFEKMGRDLFNAKQIYQHQRSAMIESVELYHDLLQSGKLYNESLNTENNTSSTRNVLLKFPKICETILTEIEPRENSSNDEQLSNSYNHLEQFHLPPEYNPNDSRWTLKIRERMPGVVELVPKTGIYVVHEELQYAKHVSKDCQSLAQQLLPEVFNRLALGVCLTLTEAREAKNSSKLVPSNVEPILDQGGCKALLKFVLYYGAQRGWNLALQSIINAIDMKIKNFRFKYNVLTELRDTS
ncbi:uncharacterized serine-rich protein C215.13-like isoform X2 [Spodoptera litura]|nr:uncharacterized serine-rich protein C215.13-like isoform X2 [Spodoptera litura]